MIGITGIIWIKLDIFTVHIIYQNISSNLFSWAGVNKKKSVLLGSSIGLGFQSMIEIMDGFSSKWGFSYSDMGQTL